MHLKHFTTTTSITKPFWGTNIWACVPRPTDKLANYRASGMLVDEDVKEAFWTWTEWQHGYSIEVKRCRWKRPIRRRRSKRGPKIRRQTFTRLSKSARSASCHSLAFAPPTSGFWENTDPHPPLTLSGHSTFKNRNHLRQWDSTAKEPTDGNGINNWMRPTRRVALSIRD